MTILGQSILRMKFCVPNLFPPILISCDNLLILRLSVYSISTTATFLNIIIGLEKMEVKKVAHLVHRSIVEPRRST